MYAMENVATLLGLAWAFVELHRVVASSSSLLCDASREILDQIAKREEEGLKICLLELEQEGFRMSDFQAAFARGSVEIASCFF